MSGNDARGDGRGTLSVTAAPRPSLIAGAVAPFVRFGERVLAHWADYSGNLLQGISSRSLFDLDNLIVTHFQFARGVADDVASLLRDVTGIEARPSNDWLRRYQRRVSYGEQGCQIAVALPLDEVIDVDLSTGQSFLRAGVTVACDKFHYPDGRVVDSFGTVRIAEIDPVTATVMFVVRDLQSQPQGVSAGRYWTRLRLEPGGRTIAVVEIEIGADPEPPVRPLPV